MRIEGEAPGLEGELFPHGLVPQILRLLVDSWSTFDPPTDDEDEPKITNRFVVALQDTRRRKRFQLRVEAHAKDVGTLDPGTGRGYVEIDICVPHGYESRCYFGIEAKKLNTTDSKGRWHSRAREYAGKDGMGCFVDGRYARYQCQGAMVGYVMDGDCPRAKSSISQAINRRAKELRVTPPCPLHPARHLPGHADAFETLHDLERGEFTIHHVLLAA
jgi:hypothetical protein